MRAFANIAALFTVVLALAVAAKAQQLPDELQPIPESAWNYTAARHLLARAGFGGTIEEVERLRRAGLETAVDCLVHYQALPSVRPPVIEKLALPTRAAMRKLGDRERHAVMNTFDSADRKQIAELRRAWIRRMMITHRPLEEKMTLFWHGLLTSGYRDVRSSVQMWTQNELFRTNAVGSYRTLIRAIYRDPAMLEYLDNRTNRKSHPNENFARELLELFTLGIGHYTETDVREAARALTGWSLEHDGTVSFDAKAHDSGTKRFLGSEGNFGADEITDLVLAQRATADRLAERLFRFFVHDHPSDEVVHALGTMLFTPHEVNGQKIDYDIAPVLTVLFKSRVFYDAATRGALIKSPVELTIGAVRQFALDANRTTPMIAIMTQQMGQTLFDPPNVKGWDGGRAWISTSTLFQRTTFAGLITRDIGLDDFQVESPTAKKTTADATEDGDDHENMTGSIGGDVRGNELVPLAGAGSQPSDDATTDDPMTPTGPAVALKSEKVSGTEFRASFIFRPEVDLLNRRLLHADAIVDYYATLCLTIPLPAAARAQLIATLNADVNGRPSAFRIAEKDAGPRVRAMLHLLLALPEYQVN